jgi:FkbM family methyltransferase
MVDWRSMALVSLALCFSGLAFLLMLLLFKYYRSQQKNYYNNFFVVLHSLLSEKKYILIVGSAFYCVAFLALLSVIFFTGHLLMVDWRNIALISLALCFSGLAFLLMILLFKYCRSQQYYNSPLFQMSVMKKHAQGILKKFNGMDMVLETQDNLCCMMGMDEWEHHVQNVLKQILRPKDRVLALGAHVGYHVLLMSQLVGEKGKVFAFEVNPSTLKLLKKNISINNLANVSIYPKAAFSKNTVVSFNPIPEGNVGASHIKREKIFQRFEYAKNYIEVEAVAIDSLPEIDAIDLLQMDIEGAEQDAVLGAQKLIDRSPNLTVVQEYTPFWLPNTDEYLNFWRSRGYGIARITKTQLIPMTDEDLRKPNPMDIILSKNLDLLIQNFRPVK